MLFVQSPTLQRFKYSLHKFEGKNLLTFLHYQLNDKKKILYLFLNLSSFNVTFPDWYTEARFPLRTVINENHLCNITSIP